MKRQPLGFAGNISRPSRTRELVNVVASRVSETFSLATVVHDLDDLGPSLGQARSLADLDTGARTIVDRIVAADALVVGTPVYKGSYTGLFKHLFDLIEPEALAGKPVLLMATGGGEKHALVIEHQLRPLFGFFEAATLPTGIYASGADFTNGIPVSPPLIARIDRAVAQFSPWLSGTSGVNAAA
ncbi:MAG: FMN reductase [Rubellimicrobium sp.]|nr:FMN reductase [Rubellimicrobium sp.]